MAKPNKSFWVKLKRSLFNLGEYLEFEEGSPSQNVVEALYLSQSDLRMMKGKFKAVDIDGSGEIDYDEFFEMIHEKRSPYADALFSLIDIDGSGSIDFEEMIQVLATYCMYSKEDVLNFCFDTFDKDGSGTIDEEEFMELCKAVNNANPMFPGNFTRALQEFDKNDDGLIDHDEFRTLNRRYPLILFPAFRLQDRMQKATLGEKRWLRIHKRLFKKRQVEEYRNTHGGDFPPLNCSQKFTSMFTQKNPYAELFKHEMKGAEVEEEPEPPREEKGKRGGGGKSKSKGGSKGKGKSKSKR
jgi:Ca2+-binding EF-hand superfamily protein